MKTPSVALALLLLPLAAAAQTAAPPPSTLLAPPPVKMGLWKTNVTSTIAGIQLPPEVAAHMQDMGKSLGQPHTINSLSCLTAEKWQHMFDRPQQNEHCTLSNLQQSSTGMSADIACTSPHGGGSSNGHMQITFDSAEKMHGTVHINAVTESQPNPMTVDMVYDGTYQGSDCQGISPDSPKILH
jgi:hypothetical protein